ncbi:poly-beta-1,6-N-acetyl-D-glucosamine N-deacetylase PgaB [Halomonas sp. V046]|uniref:poly-beta-1,6-N-acetyl-D-glucosamine N-deacetylase PgaB n=1 Tax=Halomonas sp. V046 TaxID=3459611 RepID=UPI004043E32D
MANAFHSRSHGVIARLGIALMLFTGLIPTASAVTNDVLTILCYHDIRDRVASNGDPDQFAISTQNLTRQFDWLRDNEFNVVSLDQVISASEGGQPLPPNPVMLSFDDGLESFYTHLFPLLQAYRYPAVVAVVTNWIENPETAVEYGSETFTSDNFMTWDQVREMSDSGLVEIASHSHDLHRGTLANPQGNSLPAATTREYLPQAADYEDDAQYLDRIQADLNRSAELIEQHTGKAPRVMVWPYGAYSRTTNTLAINAGMPITFGLQSSVQHLQPGMSLLGLDRKLIMDNPSLEDLVGDLRLAKREPGKRIIQIDLDYLYDDDLEQQSKNLDALISRLYRLQPDYVFLQAFADPDGDDAADAVYFPNRHLPMRADLFSRVAWQIYTRTGAEVFAWMPVLAWQLPDVEQRERLALPDPEPGGVFRLDPTAAEAREIIVDLYEDLTASAAIAGIHFHDDGLLRETELPQLYPGDPLARSQYLIDFTKELQQAAERNRSALKTSRNLFASTVLTPESRAWFAQDLGQFNAAYDYTAIMAMPWFEGSDDPRGWLLDLVEAVKQTPNALDSTIFELQAVDWRTGSLEPGQRLPELMTLLERAGVRHMGYYPDDFIQGEPPVPAIRGVISNAIFPYAKD